MSKEKRKNSSELMTALNFTDADLKAHREGHLARRQVALLNFRNVLRVGAFITFFGIMSYIMLDASGESRLAELSIMGMFALIILYTVWRLLMPVKNVASELHHLSELELDLFYGQVEQVRGELQKRATLVDNQLASSQLHIGGRQFYVSEKAYEAFLDRGYYAVYYLPRSQKLVSAELLSLPEGSNKP